MKNENRAQHHTTMVWQSPLIALNISNEIFIRLDRFVIALLERCGAIDTAKLQVARRTPACQNYRWRDSALESGRDKGHYEWTRSSRGLVNTPKQCAPHAVTFR